MGNRIKKSIRRIAVVSVWISLVFFFQNCGQGFEVPAPLIDVADLSSEVDPGVNVETPPPVIPETPIVTPIENPSASVIAATSVQGAPKSGSILQRASNGLATLNLVMNPPASAVYYRTKVISASGSQNSELVKISGKTFSVSVSSGLRTIQVSIQFFASSGQEISGFTTAMFSVGDVFLVAGQSNAATHGQTATRSVVAVNKTFSPETKIWSALNDPLPMATAQDNGGSPWPAFADALATTLSVPVAVASAAWGGSSLDHWISGGIPAANNSAPLIERLILAAQAVPGCQFKAVLWHQGESDSIAKTSTASYKSKLIQLRQTFVARTGCDKPWVVARVGFVPDDYNIAATHIENVRTAQTQLWSTTGFRQGPDTDLLTAKSHRYDGIHFSTSALKIHGLLWHDKVRALDGGGAAFTEEQRILEVQQVMNLYRTVLKRGESDIVGDFNGIYHHVKAMQNNGHTLAQITNSFVSSDEAFIQSKFLTYHRRNATMLEVRNILYRMATGNLSDRGAVEIYIRNL